MRKKKILIISGLILLLVLISIFLKKNIIMCEVLQYKPFKNNDELSADKAITKINTNIPKIEAASAFYYVGSNIVQSLYNEKVNKNELSMVSTNQAYDDLIEGKTDCIIATSPSEDQTKKINNSKIDLEYQFIYKEPLTFFVNKQNSINNLSIADIKKIYESDFDKFNTYQLQKNNGSQTCFETIVKNNKIDKRHKEIMLMPTIIDKVGKDKNGIGYAFYTYLTQMHKNKNVKIINVDGKNVKDEEYPLLFDVFLIYKKDNKNENINLIVSWLDSKKSMINNIKKEE